MKEQLTGWAIAAAAVFSLASVTADGQGGGGQGLPRASNGRPDLSGIWQVMNHAAWNIQDQNAVAGPAAAPWLGIPASRGVVEGNDIPYQPWARAKKEENYKNRLTLDPETNCKITTVVK